MSRTSFVVLFSLFGLFLTACGGGSSGSTAPVSLPPPPPVTADPPPVLAGPRPEFGPREYVLFESAPVRPVLITNNRERLIVTNIPDNRIEIFDISGGDPAHLHSVPVGMEPVSLAETADGHIWVVNHMSDSVSIVDIGTPVPVVLETLLVGDEPRDIVVAGNNKERVFVTTAHRGQNSPVDPGLTTPSIGRADIWIFDPSDLAASPGGKVETILTLFGDRPRALAVSPDKSRVYAAVFLSGNQTTAIAPGNINKPPPHEDIDGVAAPESGAILKYDGQAWIADGGQDLSSAVPFSLPDYDVFEIDAEATVPARINRWSGVGTTLFNMAVHPSSGDIFVSNLDARNHVRFAGDGSRSTTLNGHLTTNQISIIQANDVRTRNLNKHLDRSRTGGSATDRDQSLSMPMDMTFSNDGSTLYVTAFGSSKIGVYNANDLLEDRFAPQSISHIALSAGGPGGIVLDEPNAKAYVYTRFDNGVSIIDLNALQEIGHMVLPNPEPASVVSGRRFQYDARLTSGNGNDSCGTCHIFGDTDALAWDLGVPEGQVQSNPNVFAAGSFPGGINRFHSMKGPMATQSMRGLTGHGPMHWRGDRTGQNRVGDETLEDAAFKEFNEAFQTLLGRDSQISDADMQAFTDYAMQLTYPPNPIRSLDNQLSAVEARGLDHFTEGFVRVQTGMLEVCRACHTLNPANGQFGTGGFMSDNGQTGERNFKVPHFRDQYQKVGMFGWGFETAPERGPQVRGFGYNHNGATSGNFAIADLGISETDLAEIRAFLFAFPSEQAPIVGQQVTVTQSNLSQRRTRLDLLMDRARVTNPVPECDLIVKGVVEGRWAGFLMNDNGQFKPDRENSNSLSIDGVLDLLGPETPQLTFTCAPWGSGFRMALDRDKDGVLDGDEN